MIKTPSPVRECDPAASPPVPGEHAALPGPARSARVAAMSARIDWLFREALRRRQVHPLMELVRRYRQRESS